MYAAVMHLSFQPELAPAAASAFTNELLPKVKAAAGFRGGYWLDPWEGEGLGFMLFDEEVQARHASSPDQWQAPGVTVTRVDIRRVAATA
jgi:hypothetical protein